MKARLVVFYTSRAATDRVAGFASGLAHRIGRDRMREQIVESFERLRDGDRSRGGGGR